MNEQVDSAIGGYEDIHPVNNCEHSADKTQNVDDDKASPSELQEALWRAVFLLHRQSNRCMYPMDDQLRIQKEVAEFIKAWK